MGGPDHVLDKWNAFPAGWAHTERTIDIAHSRRAGAAHVAVGEGMTNAKVHGALSC